MPGAAADCKQAPELLASLRSKNVIADKGYDDDSLREMLRKTGRNPVIPGRKNRKVPVSYDRHLIKSVT